MATKRRTGEDAWREAWVKAEYAGHVVIDTDPGSGEEMLMIESKEVVTKFGERACIVDDGRTVGICVEDYVAFGVVRRPGRAPLAVNVYRLPATKRRRVDGKAGGKGQKGSTKGASWAFPEEVPAALAGEVSGVIRNQSNITGDYFIACPEVFSAYRKDAMIPVQDMPTGVGCGDSITFRLTHPLSEQAYPIAGDIQRKAGREAEEIYAKTYQGTARFKGGKGKNGKGMWKGASGAKYAPPRGSSDWRPEAVMRMVGTVKHKSTATGRHFVLCQDISDVYGRDAQIPVEEEPEGGLRVGDRIAFDVSEPREGHLGLPLARHVQVVGAAGSKRQAREAPRAAGDGEEELEDPGDGEPEEDPEVEEEGEEPERVEPTALDGEDLLDADEEARLQADEGAEAEAEALAAAEAKAIQALEASAKVEEAPEPRFALTWAKAAQASKTGAMKREPDTPEEWAKQQDTIFAGQPELRPGWIRIRSKSKGLVYYYNMKTGESRTDEPLRW